MHKMTPDVKDKFEIIFSQKDDRRQCKKMHTLFSEVNAELQDNLPLDPLALCRTANSCFLPSLVYAALFFTCSSPAISCFEFKVT